jgi:hypothetical protein
LWRRAAGDGQENKEQILRELAETDEIDYQPEP